MADLQNWSQSRAREEDPVPHEEMDPNEADPMKVGGQSKTVEQMENLALLVRQHLPEIEEQLGSMEPASLLADDQELPEHEADQMLELVNEWDDGLPELLSQIAPEDAIAISEQVQDEVQEMDPMLIAAWLWRAGELT